jgi:hypothetical protein
VEGDAIALKPAEDAEEREIGLGGGFEEPLHAVGPCAVVDDVRQMSVQGEGEKSCWLFSCLGHDGFTSYGELFGSGWLRDESPADS